MIDLTRKRIAVFGANGSIGFAVCDKLLRLGAFPIPVCKDREQATQMGLRWREGHRPLRGDVTGSLEGLSDVIRNLDGIVYAVGHCPAGGFNEAVRYPLSDIPLTRVLREWDIHTYGLVNVFQQMSFRLSVGAALVVISSAIRRLTDETCPPSFYAGHYAAAKAAQDELVAWLRRDRATRQQELRIHRLAFGAVDTPFHEGSSLRPPKFIPLTQAVDEIVAALRSESVVDKMVLPE